jgi:hypothetical protein
MHHVVSASTGSNNIVDPSGAAYLLDTKNCTVDLGAGTKVPA